MKNQNSANIADYMRLPVIVSFLILAAGLVVAYAASEVAWILIGISVAMLGAFQLFSSITSIKQELAKSSVKKNPLNNQDKFTESYKMNEENDDPFDDDDFKVVKKIKPQDKVSQSKTVSTESNDKDNKWQDLNRQISTKSKNINTGKTDNYQKKPINISNTDSKTHNQDNKYAAAQTNTEKQSTINTEKNMNTKKNVNQKDYNLKPKEENTRQNAEVKKSEPKINMESITELIKNDKDNDFKPKAELEYLLSKLLVILSSITDTKTAVFAVVDESEQEYLIESFVTTVPEKIAKNDKFQFGNDLISQIIRNKKPEILDNINEDAETDLLKYYTEKTGTRSFIGAPVFYKNQITGVLCVDSNSNDAYDESIINLLGDFKNLCSAFVSNYNEKYTLYQKINTLDAIDAFNNLVQNRSESEDSIIDAIIKSTAKVYNFDKIGICGYNESKNLWNIIALNENKNNELGAAAEINSSLISDTLTAYEPVYQKLTSSSQIRIHKNETKFDKGFFVSIPIRTQKNNFGALFAEYYDNKYLNESDINALIKISQYAALTIEKLNMAEFINTANIIDHSNGLHSPNAFRHRLMEEIIRANDFSYNISLALIKVDKYDSYEQHPDKLDQIKGFVIKKTEQHLKPYDVFGRLDGETIGVLLIEKDASKSQFWAEKVRNQIANSIIEINSKRFSVTISTGIAQVSKNQNLTDLIKNANNALEQSLNKSNTVTLF